LILYILYYELKRNQRVCGLSPCHGPLLMPALPFSSSEQEARVL